MRQIDDPEKVNVAFVQHEDFARAEAEVARLKDCINLVEMESRDGGQWGMRDVNEYVTGIVRDGNPPSQIPDDDMVICPGCVHQFRAVPVNVQARIAALEDERDALRAAYKGMLRSASGPGSGSSDSALEAFIDARSNP